MDQNCNICNIVIYSDKKVCSNCDLNYNYYHCNQCSNTCSKDDLNVNQSIKSEQHKCTFVRHCCRCKKDIAIGQLLDSITEICIDCQNQYMIDIKKNQKQFQLCHICQNILDDDNVSQISDICIFCICQI